MIIIIALAFIIATVTAVNAVAMRAIHTATVAAGCVNPRRPACQTHGRPSPCARHPARPARRPSLHSRTFTCAPALFSANFSPGGPPMMSFHAWDDSGTTLATYVPDACSSQCGGSKKPRSDAPPITFHAPQGSRTSGVNVARLVMHDGHDCKYEIPIRASKVSLKTASLLGDVLGLVRPRDGT